MKKYRAKQQVEAKAMTYGEAIVLLPTVPIVGKEQHKDEDEGYWVKESYNNVAWWPKSRFDDMFSLESEDILIQIEEDDETKVIADIKKVCSDLQNCMKRAKAFIESEKFKAKGEDDKVAFAAKIFLIYERHQQQIESLT